MRYVFGMLFKHMWVLPFAATVGTVLHIDSKKIPFLPKTGTKNELMGSLKKHKKKKRIFHLTKHVSTGPDMDATPNIPEPRIEVSKNPESKQSFNWGIPLFPNPKSSTSTQPAKNHSKDNSSSTEHPDRSERSPESEKSPSSLFSFFIKSNEATDQSNSAVSASGSNTPATVPTSSNSTTSSPPSAQISSGDATQTSSDNNTGTVESIATASVTYSPTVMNSTSQSGTLDPTFDTDGMLISSLGSGHQGTQAVHILPNGKKVILCQWKIKGKYQVALQRFQSNGILDSSFGNQGTTVTEVISKSNAYPKDLVVDSTGNILVAGYTEGGKSEDPFILRYTTDGVLDSSFGTNGIQIVSLVNSQKIYSIALQKDNKIILVGTDGDLFVTRHNTNGALDNSFDGNGILSWNVGANAIAYSVTIQPDGAILVTGSGNDEKDIVIGRILANGQLDTTFDGDGYTIIDLQSKIDTAMKVLLQSDLKIIVAGYTEVSKNDEDIVILRLLPNGSLDSSFGSAGKTIVSTGANEDRIYDALLDRSGRILLAGHTGLKSNADSLVARISPDGTVDTSFGKNGVAIVAAGSANDELHGLALEPDGKIFVVGDYDQNDYLLMRINP